MSKLTAERARERIEHLKAWQSTRGLTLREEEYLEALEISLPVLEQQENGGGDWLEWKGGVMPVNRLIMIQPKLRMGKIIAPEIASYWDWRHLGSDFDIIAYRVIEQERERGAQK